MSKVSAGSEKGAGTRINCFFYLFLLSLPIIFSGYTFAADSSPPTVPVKLIFVHHSCGENWLADHHGRLGIELGKNNYFVSDTNYGWGPDGIGDRTDITDWPEWFVSQNSARYLKAMYSESGKHSDYSRTIKDPGGENRIVMFKSCFPNSNLEGRPDDRASRGDGLTVANAKAIYNELLRYFSTRPDKLFIAITAPPVLDRTHSKNARAFNTWLTKDWLSGYKGNNVAVFDFYNILTGPNNHHRIQKRKIEYINNKGGDTLHYPTGSDEHPSQAGNLKATKEFVPVLNYYYNTWAPTAPQPPPREAPRSEEKAEIPDQNQQHESENPDQDQNSPAGTLSAAGSGDVIEDFEDRDIEWVVFSDEAKDTKLAFQRDTDVSHGSKAGMRIEYDIAPGSWATCSLVYPSKRDLSKTKGIELYLRTEKTGKDVTIVAYQGTSPDELMHFEYKARINKKGVQEWQRFKIPWEHFVQPSWQGDSSVKFNPGKSMGFAFAFDSPENRRNKGVIWVDDLTFLGKAP